MIASGATSGTSRQAEFADHVWQQARRPGRRRRPELGGRRAEAPSPGPGAPRTFVCEHADNSPASKESRDEPPNHAALVGHRLSKLPRCSTSRLPSPRPVSASQRPQDRSGRIEGLGRWMRPPRPRRRPIGPYRPPQGAPALVSLEPGSPSCLELMSTTLGVGPLGRLKSARLAHQQIVADACDSVWPPASGLPSPSSRGPAWF
jgi:hypothetical protein